jgi:hypothetical protein
MENKAKTAPYLPFLTFTNALDNIASNGVPNIIDRHSFPSFSGASVSATLGALKFFGLIGEDGTPNDSLHDLVMDRDGRKPAIKKLLEKHYPNVFALDLMRATPPQFDGAFTPELYNVAGETKVKAKTFFIKAAQYADIPMSNMLIKKTRASGKRASRKSKGAIPTRVNTPEDVTTPPASGTQMSKTITFAGGGRLTLTLDVNILELKGTDRTFVFDLIDKIEAYQDSTQTGDKEVSE